MRRLTIVLFGLFPSIIFAAPVNWTFQDVVFSDGGTLNGSFVYDADTNIYSSLTVTGSEVGPFNDSNNYGSYDCGVASGTGSAGGFGATQECNFVAAFLSINFASSLTNAGGVMSVAGYEEIYNSSTGDLLGTRIIQSGSVSAVPVPAAMWLFGSALAGLGWLRSKRAV